MTEESIFAAAVEKKDALERAAHLDQACAGDPALRQRVEALLKSHEEAGDFLGKPAFADPPTAAYQAITEGPGTRIGPYKLLQKIGEGGMGVVYMAEQEHPVRRKVALKIIKPGMDSRQVIARFEAERQALALMDHTNIARVLDAGTTDTGRPFFVMDLVKGVPITDYCDKNHLSPRERLELFVPVCQAVQHAHQKGIIHRDVKPSNVMITLYDGKPVPKMIDFGVAKAIDQRLTERTMFTQYGQIVGTLEYMSPEQAEMSGLDVDTRSDIYSLGVVLYELLTGSTPLQRRRLREAAYVEALRLVREEEAPKPSVRLTTTEEIATIAANRHMEPAKLAKLVRGELDWIVMRALEKDRTRRYETANSLGRDIERYLHDEPVEACPPSAGYKLKKFARKYKKLLATAAAFVVLVLFGAVLSIWLAVRAKQAEKGARQAEQAAREERDRALQAEQRTHRERERAEQLAAAQNAAQKFLMQEMVTQFGMLPRKFIVDLVDKTAAKIDKAFAGQPDAEAAVRNVIGNAYYQIGMPERGALQAATEREIVRKQFEKEQRVFGEKDVIALYRLGFVADAYGRAGEWRSAAHYYTRLAELVPSDHTAWYRSAVLLLYTGDVHRYRQHCQQMLERFASTDDPRIAERTAKACLLAPDATTDLKLVMSLVDQALMGTENRPNDYPWFLLAKGMAEYRAGHLDAAIEWLTKSQKRTGAPDFYRMVKILCFLSMAHAQSGRTEEARQSLNQAIQIMKQKFPKADRGNLEDWDDWLMCQIIRKEAEAVLKTRGTGTAN